MHKFYYIEKREIVITELYRKWLVILPFKSTLQKWMCSMMGHRYKHVLVQKMSIVLIKIMLAVVTDKSLHLSGLRQRKLTCSCRIQNVFFYSEQVSISSAVIQGLSKCDSAFFNTAIFYWNARGRTEKYAHESFYGSGLKM